MLDGTARGLSCSLSSRFLTWCHDLPNLCVFAPGIQCLPAGLRRFLAGEGMSSSLSLLAAFFLPFLLCLLAPPVLAAGADGASQGATSAGSPASRQALLKAASTESHISLQGRQHVDMYRRCALGRCLISLAHLTAAHARMCSLGGGLNHK